MNEIGVKKTEEKRLKPEKFGNRIEDVKSEKHWK